MLNLKKRISILNIWVDPLTREEALNRVEKYLIQGHRPHLVFAVNPEKNFSIIKDHLLYNTFKSADLLIPDGVGIVIAARILYGIRISRVPGVEFMESLCELAAGKGYRIFIYGAKEDVSRKAVENIRMRYPSVQIVGRSHGYVEQKEMPSLIQRINESKAEILFLALGSPKQEKWLANYAEDLRYVRVCQGIGGTLDTIAGNVKRAPDIWCRLYLEWLYRLISGPERIKRQWVLPLFAVMVLTKKISSLISTLA
jgi:N-acetylglucosaminyldiphosphoundecaprenol N-acetyl-beta-D-mannosaminyltransferase